MILFGAVLVLAGLFSYFMGETAVFGLEPDVVGLSLLVLGGVVLAVAVARRVRARRDSPETEPIGGPVRRLRAVPRLIRSAGREYPGMRRRHLALWALAVVYLISPVDLIPAFLPIIGFTDDAALLFWLLGDVSAHSGRFLNWERRRGPSTEISAGSRPEAGRDESEPPAS
ncbi:hypothetical protein FHR81_003787 [Actinoalloteichus hoggarensis]|uniref:Uncharacterized protein n=1 Tax=Actinoalloteichus hoggarensis TaxID=1470176 RepID=A0A221WBI3_9PSEU|nr:YkvA family protein [Actinoalloteichus hoggarensis]ASO23124.1 hypothetical protein AHOG_27635 [Actinoalloteichus hoggarensis]MBB5922730.1 hypothetical protein [Actinoalloteichus hoggarensis]